jgi:hypothetical protein
MAELRGNPAKLTFKLNSGEIKNGRPVIYNATLSNIQGASGADDLEPVIAGLGGCFKFAVDSVILTRTDTVEI